MYNCYIFYLNLTLLKYTIYNYCEIFTEKDLSFKYKVDASQTWVNVS